MAESHASCGDGAMLMLNRYIRHGCLLLAASAAILLVSCGGGSQYAPEIAAGGISGELTIVGPVKTNDDFYVGAVLADQDEPVQVEPAGRFVSQAGIDARALSFDFSGLPLSAYNILVYTQDPNGDRHVFYRSPKLKLTLDEPRISGFSEDVSLTGPPPWGTISGTLLLNGANNTLPSLSLYVYTEERGKFRYTFDVWDAGFGVLFFTVGGLAAGDYHLGISDPDSLQLLGYDAERISITPREPDAAGVTVVGDFFNVPPPGEGFYISGKAIFNDELPAGRYVAVLALDAKDQLLALNATYHIRPELLDEDLEADYFLGWLRAGEYRLAIYALDFLTGDHTLINELDVPITINHDHPLDTGIIIRGDVALIP